MNLARSHVKHSNDYLMMFWSGPGNWAETQVLRVGEGEPHDSSGESLRVAKAPSLTLGVEPGPTCGIGGIESFEGKFGEADVERGAERGDGGDEAYGSAVDGELDR